MSDALIHMTVKELSMEIIRGTELVMRAIKCNNLEYFNVHSRLKLPTFDYKPVDHDRSEKLRQDLLAVQGVTTVSSHKYQISIQKATLFCWDEIIPAVMNILRDYAAEIYQVPEGGRDYEVANTTVQTESYFGLGREFVDGVINAGKE